MKSRFFSIIIALLALCAVCPDVSAQFRWGAQVGMNFNSYKFKQDLFSVGSTVGESVGVAAEMMFPGIGFGLDMGLRYEQLGAKLGLGEKPMWSTQGYGDERIYVHNIQIPFHLKFKYTRFQGFEDYLAPFVYGGPTFNIQAAHSRCDAIKYAGGDLGLTVGFGAEIFRRWQLSGSYTWGMTYAMKMQVLANQSCRSRTWDIRLAYFF